MKCMYVKGEHIKHILNIKTISSLRCQYILKSILVELPDF